MLEAITILDVLEEKTPSIEFQLGSRGSEFSRNVGKVAEQFKVIAGEQNPEAAAGNLELAVNDLLDICWDYLGITFLPDQDEQDLDETEFDSGGMMRPTAPALPNIMKIKELANRYYDLLTKLKEMTQAKG